LCDVLQDKRVEYREWFLMYLERFHAELHQRLSQLDWNASYFCQKKALSAQSDRLLWRKEILILSKDDVFELKLTFLH